MPEESSGPCAHRHAGQAVGPLQEEDLGPKGRALPGAGRGGRDAERGEPDGLSDPYGEAVPAGGAPGGSH